MRVIRRVARRIISDSRLARNRYYAWCRRGPSVTILMYHNIVVTVQGGVDTVGLDVSVDRFESQMSYLARNYDVVSLSGAVNILREGRRRGKYVSVTFDDGYAGSLQYARSICRAYNIPTTFFLCPEILSTGKPYWWDRVEFVWNNNHGAKDVFVKLLQRRLLFTARQPTLSDVIHFLKQQGTDQVELLLKECNIGSDSVDPCRKTATWAVLENGSNRDMSVGSHSMGHENLVKLDASDLRDNLATSREILQGSNHDYVDVFAYPFGFFDERVMAEVRSSGYRYALTTVGGDNSPGMNPYRLRRISVGNEEVKVFARSILYAEWER